MKTTKKIRLGLGFISAFIICVIFLGVSHPNHSQAIPVPQNINPIAGYLKDGNYHFWVDPSKPATMNAQIPKDSDPTKNLYFFKHNSTKNGNWVYTTAGTSNPGLFCSGTSITTADLSGLPNAQTPQSNIVGDFKYVYPGNISKCSPPLGRGEINPLAIDVTTNASGVPGSGVKGAPCNSGADCVNGVCQKDGGLCFNTSSTGQSSQSCESNFDSPLGWIICPALGLADSAAGAFNGFVDDQLCFKTTDQSSSSTGTSVVCKGNNNLDKNVQNAWSIFKNIASALLVIVMLVMVFSQAIGGGPVDAYTARKMLPKLVAAVIIMQLSWILLKFAIDLSNDIGKSIAAVMEAPFGGINKLTLKSMVSVDLSAHGTGTNNVVFFSALAAGTVGAVALSIPGLAMLALYVVLALLTAFIVLLLRKLLIILLVILAPVALILWILPGTERYWKMWWDNFIKLIAMFPIIMALIAAGRIFADITAGNSAVMFNIHLAVAHIGPLTVPYVASFSNFADLAIIIGAFFGPYFFLPQTFKWGGMAMGAVSQGVQKGMESGAKPAKEYLNWRKGLTPWAQARAARKAEIERREKLGFYENLGASGALGSMRRARLGGVGRRGSEREIREAIARRGRQQVEAEETKAAQEALLLEISQAADHDQFLRDVLFGNEDANWTDTYGNEHRIGQRSEWQRVAAFGELARLGGATNMRAIQEAHARAQAMGTAPGSSSEEVERGGRERELMKKAMDANAQTLLPKMKTLYFGGDNLRAVHSVIEGMKASDLGSMDGQTMETILGRLTTEIQTNPVGSDNYNTALRDLATVYSTYYQAANNESLRGQMAPSLSRAIKASINGNPELIDLINPRRVDAAGNPRPGNPLVRDGTQHVAPTDPASPTIRLAVESVDPNVPAYLQHIETHVDDSGNVSA